MKRVLIFSFVALFAFVLAAAAEDLGEVAKKEKARREELQKQGKKGKVLTNADVANIKSQLAIQPSSDSAAQNGEANPQTAEATENSEQQNAPKPPSAEQEELDLKIQALENQKEQVQQQIEDARNAIGQGGVYHSVGVGNQYQTVSESEQKLQVLNQQINALRQQQQQLQEQQQQQQQPPEQQQQQQQQ